ncbi:leukotriene B4 receptor 1-like [Hyla sarda]|uniref:leukotriene B4 receptor 1-like n=1 Tax=Hyla sarda TaxID=327740 RepID=UPI0024C3B2A0|nr:leukotriene B4 receptor 1-like [Hyla sarda]
MTEANATLGLTKTSIINSTFTNSTEIPVLSAGISTRVGIAILSIAFMIGFPGNAFVIWTILTQIKKRTVTCLLIFHLAVADIIVILTAPFFLHVLSTGSWTFCSWTFGEIICKVCYYICGLGMYTSVFLIMFMSIDRFLAVVRPFTSQKMRTKPVVRGIVASIWISASLLAVTMIFYRTMVFRNGRPQCELFHNSTEHIVFQCTFEALTGFVIPFTIIVSCYVYIGLRLRTAKFQTKQKTNRLVIMIIVTFALFWLPYHTINILQVSGEIFSSKTLTMAAKKARPNAIAFAYFSSSTNPILYVFAAGNFIRTAGVGFMAKLFEGTASENSSVRKISQAFRHRSQAESVEVEKCLDDAEPSKNVAPHQAE